MSSDEIKRIEKGHFVVLKTGPYPIQIKIPFYTDWSIEFNNDYVTSDRDISTPKYVTINDLKHKIIGNVIDN